MTTSQQPFLFSYLVLSLAMRLFHLGTAVLLTATASASAIPQAPNLFKALLSMLFFVFVCPRLNLIILFTRCQKAIL